MTNARAKHIAWSKKFAQAHRRAAEALCADLTISDPFANHTPESLARDYPDQVKALAEQGTHNVR
jgi:hypothetical protein